MNDGIVHIAAAEIYPRFCGALVGLHVSPSAAVAATCPACLQIRLKQVEEERTRYHELAVARALVIEGMRSGRSVEQVLDEIAAVAGQTTVL